MQNISPDYTADSGLSACGTLARRYDYERYFGCLFAAPQEREAMFALLALNFEVARIPEIVSEPMVGMIRLAWWRDAIQDMASGKPPRHHDVLQAIHLAMQHYSLPAELLIAMIEARQHDLEKINPLNLEELERYAGETSGRLHQLIGRVCGLSAPDQQTALKQLGTSWALLGLMRAVIHEAGSARYHLPDSLLQEQGIETPSSSTIPAEALMPVITRILKRANELLEEAKQNFSSPLSKKAYPALVTATIAGDYLRQLRDKNYSTFKIDKLGLTTPLKLKVVIKSWLKRI
jgi:phytoene synthase